MTHLHPDQIHHQQEIARDIVCAVAAYLETDDVPPRVILNAIEDAKADLGLATKETAA